MGGGGGGGKRGDGRGCIVEGEGYDTLVPTQALADYSAVMLISKEPGVKVLINRGLLYLQQKDYGNALLDLADAGKVIKHTI